jgi:hypothetical protein
MGTILSHAMERPDSEAATHQSVCDGSVTLLLGLHLLQAEELLALQLIQLTLSQAKEIIRLS